MDEKLTMNAAKNALLLSLPTLLVGCGGSSGGGGGSAPAPVPTTYTWQIVSLNSLDRGSVDDGCSILAEDSLTTGNVIAAYEATSANINILYHDATGTVLSSSNVNSSGQYTIDIADVPDNGYVSLEELNGNGNDTAVYMFTVQKSLLSDMTLSVSQHFINYNCLEEEQSPQIEIDSNAVVNIADPNQIANYFHASYPETNVTGSINGTSLQVNSPLPATSKVLVTLFNNYTNNEATALEEYAVINAEDVYNSNNGISPNYAIPTNLNKVDLDLDIQGQSVTGNVEVNLDGNLYTWQPIYNSTQQYSFIDGSSPFTSWNMSVIGQTDLSGWLSAHSIPVTNIDINVTTPSLSTLSTNNTFVSANCADSDFCLSSPTFQSNSFDIQRTHVRSKMIQSQNNRHFYQTIFATPNSEQVLMNSSIGSTFNPDITDRVEVSLAQTLVNTNTIKAFMQKSLNLENIVNSVSENYYDFNALIPMPSESKSRKLDLMDTEMLTYSSGVGTD